MSSLRALCNRSRIVPWSVKRRWLSEIAGDEDYFTLLGARYGFSVDEDQLYQEHKKLMKSWHPDRFADDAKAQERALSMASMINSAYSTLCKPHLRARYILEVEGIPLKEDEDAPVDDMEFLGFVMSVREALENEPKERDLEDLKSQINELSNESVQQAEAALSQIKSDPEMKEVVRKQASKLQYLHRISEEIHKLTQVT
ncbi:hypothetical protein NDN08_000844 [Rhodosorus marinus]|uniref:J domain-containing protein n=1 Tax=Rhodosorus marinus TaxID=101924 RepID=A0AAV8UP95_9RHOD|nr:hypothetical protein NDN08_000844 [Rhodosorus marinus]